MSDLAQAYETSCYLAEKLGSDDSASLRERSALADFAAFGLFKRARIEPEAISALQRGLGMGIGVGLPALGVAHLAARDARHQGQELIRDARNQALMTAAGIGGMQGLGALLQQRLSRPAAPAMQGVQDEPMPSSPVGSDVRVAAAILVDDVLEAACNDCADDNAKHAALVSLVEHRRDSMHILRDWLRAR